MSSAACRICGEGTEPLGPVHGAYSGRDYALWRCGACRYAYIADPWIDFAEIYDDRYYAGRGADPMVDYAFELAHPEQTVRTYEWRGVTGVVEGLLGSLRGTRWLDFGCGNGGLVRHVRSATPAEAYGFEEGSMAVQARALGLPLVGAQELPGLGGSFDVVTAIEVLEHTLDPVLELRRMRELLRPGGLLFLTTGNAAPFAAQLTKWSYVVPEIHISFFEPSTLAQAFEQAGFRAVANPRSPGFDQILKFKVLKNLRIRSRTVLTDLMPATPVARVADLRTRLGEMPIGWAV